MHRRETSNALMRKYCCLLNQELLINLHKICVARQITIFAEHFHAKNSASLLQVGFEVLVILPVRYGKLR